MHSSLSIALCCDSKTMLSNSLCYHLGSPRKDRQLASDRSNTWKTACGISRKLHWGTASWQVRTWSIFLGEGKKREREKRNILICYLFSYSYLTQRGLKRSADGITPSRRNEGVCLQYCFSMHVLYSFKYIYKKSRYASFTWKMLEHFDETSLLMKHHIITTYVVEFVKWS